MSRLMVAVKDGWIYTRPVVANPEPEVMLVVTDLRLDSLGMGMPNRIAHRFGSDPVDLISNNWIERFGRSFYSHCWFGSGTAQELSCEIAYGPINVNRSG